MVFRDLHGLFQFPSQGEGAGGGCLKQCSRITLNNNLSFKAYKIDDIFPYRMLTPEFEAVKTLGPQMRPQDPLGICRR